MMFDVSPLYINLVLWEIMRNQLLLISKQTKNLWICAFSLIDITLLSLYQVVENELLFDFNQIWGIVEIIEKTNVFRLTVKSTHHVHVKHF